MRRVEGFAIRLEVRLPLLKRDLWVTDRTTLANAANEVVASALIQLLASRCCQAVGGSCTADAGKAGSCRSGGRTARSWWPGWWRTGNEA
jgi:hypothetical protein